MNKKRFLIFLSIISIAVLIILLLSFHNNKESGILLLSADQEAEVNLFYFRAVPGLKRAEELGLVTSINKSFDLPGMKSKLTIDRIWYNNKNVVLFYHVENFTKPALLGGDLYLPSQEPVKKTTSWGWNALGRANEKGIIYRGSFYSCLIIPVLKDSSGKQLTEIESMIYKPYLTMYNNAGTQKETTQILSIKAFPIQINYRSDQEHAAKYSQDSSIEFDQRKLLIYQSDITPSANRVYFRYLHSGRDVVYRVKGSYRTDKGETYSFDATPAMITDFPYHYYFDIPPFHKIPNEMILTITSLHCVGRDRITFEMDTGPYNKNNGIYTMDQSIDSLRNIHLKIDGILLNKSYVDLIIGYHLVGEPSKPYARLEPQIPVQDGLVDYLENILRPQSMIHKLSISNEENDPYGNDQRMYGAVVEPDSTLTIRLSRTFWNQSRTIRIQLENFSYRYELDRDVVLRYTP